MVFNGWGGFLRKIRSIRCHSSLSNFEARLEKGAYYDEETDHDIFGSCRDSGFVPGMRGNPEK